MSQPFELPALSPEAEAHCARLLTHIIEQIEAAGGWIDFARYMELALYAPGLGYYSAGAAKFGPEGDFVTAPEISPLFARCLARACAPWLAADPRRVMIELGAGSGAFAAEFLPALQRLGVGDNVYRILEVSADLRERQQATLRQRAPAQGQRVEWLDALPSGAQPAIVFANEVADALPVQRFEISAEGVREQGVAIARDGRLTWEARSAGEVLKRAVSELEAARGAPFSEGYRSEVCLRLSPWVAALAACVSDGLILLCDYGLGRREFYHPDRSDGTLICHYRHRAHPDPFLHPGLQDITAWVDFSAVAAAAAGCGLQLAGYATQAHFLLDAGIERELSASADAGGIPDLRLVQQAKTLLLPGEMGERFKVMALTRGTGMIDGFKLRDLRHLL
jgi:SAM-dependent MidA family methyltransferase